MENPLDLDAMLSELRTVGNAPPAGYVNPAHLAEPGILDENVTAQMSLDPATNHVRNIEPPPDFVERQDAWGWLHRLRGGGWGRGFPAS